MKKNYKCISIDESFYYDISDLLLKRDQTSDASINDLISDMANHIEEIEKMLEKENMETNYFSREVEIKQFYIKFGLLIHYLEPIMEQLETIAREKFCFKGSIAIENENS